MKMTFAQWLALSPILIISLTIVVVMMAIAIKRHHWWNATFAVAGLNAALLACSVLFFGPLMFPGVVPQYLPQSITPLVVIDSYSIFYMGLILSATLATATLSHAYIDGYAGNKEEIYLLLMLSSLGAILLACSKHFASLFLGLELLSIPLYGMVAYPLKNRHPLEAGVKYLVLSAAASAFLLFGMALIYARTGTLAFAELAPRMNGLHVTRDLYMLTGGALLIAGLAFKLSLVPFHLWTPDVYEGAPAPVTSYLATASKTAVFAVLLRWFVQGGADRQGLFLDVLALLAIASILVGNVLALQQTNIKRMLAYSSIAHLGYCLVAVVAGGPLAVEAVGAYLLTYVVTTLGAFGVVTLMSSPIGDNDADEIDDYRGLFWTRPFLSSILTVAMLSLAGIPLTAGFIGKFYITAVGVDARLWVLLGAVVIGSAIGLYYYLRLMIALYNFDAREAARRRRFFDADTNWAQQAGGYMVLLLMLLMMILGMYPEPFLLVLRAANMTAF
ncbi:MAG TPA: NADH-quinone oxidoreductase subunit NuoN [Nevskiaceae bacterium]|nr:NADH-quinone oxidoreductase subunit NuoN [Nevskiaceae bacterium]